MNGKIRMMNQLLSLQTKIFNFRFNVLPSTRKSIRRTLYFIKLNVDSDLGNYLVLRTNSKGF